MNYSESERPTLDEVVSDLEDLESRGLVERAINDDGETVYRLTQAGEVYAGAIRNGKGN